MPHSDDPRYPAVPFGGAYWVVAGSFLAGCHPCFYAPQDCPGLLSGIVDAGIRRFIDLTEAKEWIPGTVELADYATQVYAISKDRSIDLRCLRQAVVDHYVPSHAGMVEILDTIDESTRNNLPVYVHCMGGIGRTGTVVGCYLARHGYAAGDDVIKYIAKLRTHIDFIDWPSPESRQQVKMVMSWEKGK